MASKVHATSEEINYGEHAPARDSSKMLSSLCSRKLGAWINVFKKEDEGELKKH
jgi:hypothetical protein